MKEYPICQIQISEIPFYLSYNDRSMSELLIERAKESNSSQILVSGISADLCYRLTPKALFDSLENWDIRNNTDRTENGTSQFLSTFSNTIKRNPNEYRLFYCPTALRFFKPFLYDITTPCKLAVFLLGLGYEPKKYAEGYKALLSDWSERTTSSFILECIIPAYDNDFPIDIQKRLIAALDENRCPREDFKNIIESYENNFLP